MRRDKLTQVIVMVFLFVVVISMSIYYAVRSYTDLIDTEGTIKIEAPEEWDINFKWDSYEQSAESVEGNVTFGSNYITYDAVLKEPGEFFEFSVDVKNNGYAAGLLSYVVVSIEGDGRDYTTSTIMYDGIELHEGLNDNINSLIVPAQTKKVYFKVLYNDIEDYHNLPHEDKNIKITAAFNYIDYEE